MDNPKRHSTLRTQLTEQRQQNNNKQKHTHTTQKTKTRSNTRNPHQKLRVNQGAREWKAVPVSNNNMSYCSIYQDDLG
jgi:hypothetical protein